MNTYYPPNDITPAILAAMGSLPTSLEDVTVLRQGHAGHVGHYRCQLAIVSNQLTSLKGKVASEARSNLVATGGKPTDKAVEAEVDNHPEVAMLRLQRDLLEAAVETLQSREEMLRQLSVG